jgi:hypothetical protein
MRLIVNKVRMVKTPDEWTKRFPEHIAEQDHSSFGKGGASKRISVCKASVFCHEALHLQR